MNPIIRKGLEFLPDKCFINLKYYYHFRRFPNLNNPKTYNEKLQWLKIHDRNPLYTKLVDKYEAKKYLVDAIGADYIIPTYGVWDSFDEINFDKLPNRFVLKTTHDCGGVVICYDKSSFDISKARTFLNSHLKRNYFYEGREWPYKNVVPRIMAEKCIAINQEYDLMDYKVFTFNGEPKVMFVAANRQSNTKDTTFDFFDVDFNPLKIKNGHPNSDEPIKKPNNLHRMLEISKRISTEFPHMRVDFYEVDGKLYVGELTLYHFSGMVPFYPEKWDEIFGSWLHLPVDKVKV